MKLCVDNIVKSSSCYNINDMEGVIDGLRELEDLVGLEKTKDLILGQIAG